MSEIEKAEQRRQQLLQEIDQRRQERAQIEARRAELVEALEGVDGLERPQERITLETQIAAIDSTLVRFFDAETPARYELGAVESKLKALRTEANNVRLSVKTSEGMLLNGLYDIAIKRAEFALEMAKLEKRQQVDGLLAAYARLTWLEGEPAARSLAAKHGRVLP